MERVRPLVSVISYNRRDETMRTISALLETGTLDDAEVVLWDNGSTDGTADFLDQVRSKIGDRFRGIDLVPTNIGCPKALNKILHKYRRPGQHYIKVDNDVVLETQGWAWHMADFLAEHLEVGMASPWYSELETANQGKLQVKHSAWWQVFPVIGHCVIHRGRFLDQTGYFDILADDHLYGFEDLLMAHRAVAAGYKCAVNLRVTMKNIQRKNSLDASTHSGECRAEHIDRLRAGYDYRIYRIHNRQGYYKVSRNGKERT